MMIVDLVDGEDFRERLVALGLTPSPFSNRLIKKGELIEHGATVRCASLKQIDALALALREDKKVVEFEIQPRNH